MFAFGIWILVKRFSHKSFYRLLLDPSLSGEPVFNVDINWRIKIPKKVKFLYWKVLLDYVNTFGRLVKRTSLVGFFSCILCRRWRKTWIISFRVVNMWEWCGVFCYKVQHSLRWVERCSCNDRGVYPPSAFQRERLLLAGLCLVVQDIWGKEVLKVFRERERNPWERSSPSRSSGFLSLSVGCIRTDTIQSF